uniref:Gamma-secretase subunit PEN-2 (Trinotate prediction) n=1 Tax=Henneguya salminicola TaxID=69463 RepID=A0A6G3MM61_HENSL
MWTCATDIRNMNIIEQVSSDEKAYRTCRNYFCIGIFFNPLLLLINSYQFCKRSKNIEIEHFKRRTKYFVMLSLIFGFFYIVLFGSWYCIYLIKRTSMGFNGDYISISIPLGQK